MACAVDKSMEDATNVFELGIIDPVGSSMICALAAAAASSRIAAGVYMIPIGRTQSCLAGSSRYRSAITL